MLDLILLIDDDAPTNMLNSIIIKKLNCCKQVVAQQRADLALEYLKELGANQSKAPDLILLDINMPGMNGWEFLEEYEKLEQNLKANAIVVMLTTSLNPEDEKRSKEVSHLSSFENKPLTKEKMLNILNRYFPERNFG